MDKFCPIFPFQQHEEDHHNQFLDFENTISTFQFQPPYIIQENLVTNHTLVDSTDVGSFFNYNIVGDATGTMADFHHQPTFVDNNLGHNNNNSNNKRQHRSSFMGSGNVGFDDNDDEKEKKIIHKEIERQRRSQMANLYASLKSLLPLHSIKGRQSTSDLLHEAENHIRMKQKNIEELRVQRDGLKKWREISENNNNNPNNETLSSLLPCKYCPVDISVTSHLGGMEILISIDLGMDGFQLSRVLDFVIAEGLCVVSCVCTRTNGKIIHIIQTEVTHLEVMDAYDLKQKLFEYC